MDGQQQVSYVMDNVEQMGFFSKLLSCLCACGYLAAAITITVYFGIYAFNNPNEPAWYIPGTDLTEPELVPVAPNDGTGTAIHDDFVTWFLWNFINQIILFSSPFIFIISICIGNASETLGKLFHNIVSCGFCVTFFVAWIMGMVWRFGEAGKFASGDDLLPGEAADPLMQI